MSFHVPESRRIVRHPSLGSTKEAGNNGGFMLKPIIADRYLVCIASDGLEWEHVSIHINQGHKPRTPNWQEMHYAKNIFWDPEDVVMQLHPRQSEYINCQENTLHLWRPIGQVIPTPPNILVGVKD